VYCILTRSIYSNSRLQHEAPNDQNKAPKRFICGDHDMTWSLPDAYGPPTRSAAPVTVTEGFFWTAARVLRLRPFRHRWPWPLQPASGSRLGSAARRWGTGECDESELAHRASWGPAGASLGGLLPPRGKEAGKVGCLAAGPWKIESYGAPGRGPKASAARWGCDVWRLVGREDE
jgi:hypothetical protein